MLPAWLLAFLLGFSLSLAVNITLQLLEWVPSLVLSVTDKALVQFLDRPWRRKAAVHHQAADWISPVNAARTASSRSASVRGEI